jgi:hypothetical protein
MNKDVIYIDVDDDVTAIIGKIKKAKEKIVAIVPPKRTGTLQSAVNLRLLDRMAKHDKKQLVLITNNPALIALAASSLIPVAKNLQTKPEIAEIAAIAVDDGDDIIDGADLPIGDHAGSLKIKDSTRPGGAGLRSDAIDSIDVDGESSTDSPPILAAATYGASKFSGSPKSNIKIPNFDRFRKRLFFGIGGGILLIALLIWMFVFAPAATIIVTAATTPTPISSTIKLGGTAATDFKTGVVKSVMQQEKKDETIAFDATGTKDLGTPATGTVKFSTADAATAINGVTIPAGTKLATTSGLIFTTNSAAVISPQNYMNVQVLMTASGNGTDYNAATGVLSGAPSKISASIVDATANGTSKIVKVPSQDDIDRATGQLVGISTDAEKKTLTALFKNGEKVIDSSFTIDRAPAVSAPAVNTESATGKATLTISTTYSLYAVASAELESYLNSSLLSQIKDAKSQKVYDSGIKNAGLSNFSNQAGAITVAVTATGQIGPKIDEVQIKNQVKGKIYGEVQSTLQEINGIKNVDVKFSYFWVRTVPNNTSKIHIQFLVQNE